MLTARLSELALWLAGRVHGADVPVRGVSQDTRALSAGMLYVAIRGERLDGHDFLQPAAQAGAAAALVAQADPQVDLPQLIVADPLRSLGELARRHRSRMPAQVVGITGSNGKTTVKTLVASILGQVGPCLANRGNRNNEIGLPLSVLELTPAHRYAVFEMGAGQPGDIAYLAALAAPQVGVVNNIAPAHLERMGTLDGVAATKGALYEALPAEGWAIINADDAYAEFFARRVSARNLLRYGLEAAADIRAENIEAGERIRFVLQTPHGSGVVRLSLPGRHNVANALAAAAVACALEIPFQAIVQGLETAASEPGRLRVLRQQGGYTLIDDTYNANPASVGAAIETLAGLDGESWLVLGDMAELGADAESMHAQIGALARQAGIRRMFTLGVLSRAAAVAFGVDAEHFDFDHRDDLVGALRQGLHPGVVCLVKGSRSAGMEQVLAPLVEGGLDHAA